MMPAIKLALVMALYCVLVQSSGSLAADVFAMQINQRGFSELQNQTLAEALESLVQNRTLSELQIQTLAEALELGKSNSGE